MSDLDAEFEHFLANKAEYLKLYRGKFLALKDRNILGVYDDRLVAIRETAKLHPLGTFLVQYVTDADEIVRFHSRYSAK